ncbi:MAG: universal stress protein [Anaerolineae bacterium]|nr:universal stress protein [Anaerolineae bacterium]
MNTGGQRYKIRRIVVALDASPHSYAALEAAVRMAAHFGAELLGLYVEDINMLRLAELPFVREVGSFSTASRRVESQDIERQLRLRTLTIQRKFISLATQQQVQQTFRVTRGKVVAEIREAAAKADVLIVGKAGWSQVSGRRLGSTARAAYSNDTPDLTVILQDGARLGTPLLVVYDGSPLGQKALDVAAALMRARTGPIHVLLLADGQMHVTSLHAEAAARLQAYDIEGRYRVLTESNVPKLSRAIQSEHSATLIIPAKIALFREDALLGLLEEVDVPILLVR